MTVIMCMYCREAEFTIPKCVWHEGYFILRNKKNLGRTFYLLPYCLKELKIGLFLKEPSP